MAIDESRISKFIKFTASGIEVADFSEIRSAIIERYQDAYGSDIDLNTACADGIFINNLALIINNILQTMVTLYSNLDVDYAVGNYLDTLCALSNVRRKEATNSTASILITNVGSNDIANIYELTFVDNAGTKWLYKTEEPLSIARNETLEIKVVCEEVGPVKAPAGFITRLINVYPLAFTQQEDAIVGFEVESDDELRARRAQSLGLNGLTVLESLRGALLEINGIRDVYIYNNNKSSSKLLPDTTTVEDHSIYVVLRQEEGVTIANETIGTIIHNKLTPGIATVESGEGINDVHYDYVEKAYNTTITESTQRIHWKRAQPIYQQIDIEINPYDYFTEDEVNPIGQAVISYANNLHIGEYLDKNQILLACMDADPRFKGRPTFYVENIEIDENTYTENPLSYYFYNHVEWNELGNIITVTFVSEGE